MSYVHESALQSLRQMGLKKAIHELKIRIGPKSLRSLFGQDLWVFVL